MGPRWQPKEPATKAKAKAMMSIDVLEPWCTQKGARQMRRILAGRRRREPMMESTNATAEEFRGAREASGPPDVSLWRVLRGYRADPLVRWTAIRETHGDVARYRFAGIDTFFVSSAEGARRILQDNAANYTKQHPTYRTLRRLFGNRLLTSDGSFWLRQRRLAQPAFHKERIARVGAVMAAAAHQTAQRWEAEAAAGRPVAMAEEMSRLTLQVVGDALFGSALSPRAPAVGASWKVLSRQLAERFSRRRLLPPVLPTRYDREFRRARRTLLDVVEAIIAERRAGGDDGDDLLAMFMRARDEETGERMDDAQLRDEVVTMLLAGHETTALALTWTWALLDAHRAAAAGLRDELGRVLGRRAPTAADFPSLPFARAVISEALRLHPPAHIINRAVTADDVVLGRQFRCHRGSQAQVARAVRKCPSQELYSLLCRRPAPVPRFPTDRPTGPRGGASPRRSLASTLWTPGM